MHMSQSSLPEFFSRNRHHILSPMNTILMIEMETVMAKS